MIQLDPIKNSIQSKTLKKLNLAFRLFAKTQEPPRILDILPNLKGEDSSRTHHHQDELLDVLQLPKSRLPSLSTLRRVLVRVDYEQFTAAFNAWAQSAFGALEHEQLAADGKAVKASLRDYEESYQDFVALVSAFSVRQGIVMAVEPMQNGKNSEIQTVQTLLDKLQLTGVCLSLDALHTQKTLQHIIERGNDYLVAVKQNQRKLFAHLESQFALHPPQSIDCQTEHSRDRTIERTVSVLDQVTGIDPDWVGVQRLIRVQRCGYRGRKPFQESMFYISSLPLNAQEFAQRIRQHWHVENRLH